MLDLDRMSEMPDALKELSPERYVPEAARIYKIGWLRGFRAGLRAGTAALLAVALTILGLLLWNVFR